MVADLRLRGQLWPTAVRITAVWTALTWSCATRIRYGSHTTSARSAALWIAITQDISDKHQIAESLRHLVAGTGDDACIDPVSDERLSVNCFDDRALAFMVRQDEIRAAAVISTVERGHSQR